MSENPVVSVIMGSQSDWDTMRHAIDTLEKLGIPCEARIMSAHRTPARVVEYVEPARERGLKVIIGAAGGAAALPGAIAAKGGWFSNTMTSALSKYDNGAVLAGAAAADTAAANNAPKTSGIDLSR